MEKIKKWLEPTKNKVIAGVIAVLVIAGGSYGVWALTQNKVSEPVVIFKDNIVFEYGEDVSNDINKLIGRLLDKDNENNVDLLASYVKDDNHEQKLKELSTDKDTIYFVIEEIKSDVASFGYQTRAKEVGLIKQDSSVPNYNTEVLLNKENLNQLINSGGNPEKAETSNVTKFKSKVNVMKNGHTYKSFDFEYVVIDSQAPGIEGNDEVTLKHDESFDVTKYKANDPVDGEIAISVAEGSGEVVDGQTTMTLVATDKNGNETRKEVKVTIKEAPVAEEPVDEPASGNNNTANTGGSISNNSGTNKPSTGGSGSSNNSGGSTTEKPTQPTPEKPSEPNYLCPNGKDKNKPCDAYVDPVNGYLTYKTYPTMNACKAAGESILDEWWEFDGKDVTNYACTSANLNDSSYGKIYRLTLMHNGQWWLNSNQKWVQ